MSRSAFFYKYKDGIYPLSKLERERLVTVSMELEHRSGTLSKVLAAIAVMEGNVLTIHQTIPLQGMATVILSIDTSHMGENLPFFCWKSSPRRKVSNGPGDWQGMMAFCGIQRWGSPQSNRNKLRSITSLCGD